MHFASRDEELYADTLRDWWGNSYSRRLISIDGRLWFVKCKSSGEQKRDLLASLIGQGWLNIPEVRTLTLEQFSQLADCGISLPQNAEVENTYLVRFGPDLDVHEVPLKDPDQALAYELVFSMWIRRRDAHAFNRIYKFGVPIFYDFGTAFLGEPRLADLNWFFGPPRNSGWPGAWRITQGTSLDLDTQALRNREVARFRSENGKVLFPILNRARFFDELENSKRAIARLDSRQLRETIDASGFSAEESAHIFEFLLQSRSQINDALRRLRSVIMASWWRHFFRFPSSRRSHLNP